MFYIIKIAIVDDDEKYLEKIHILLDSILKKTNIEEYTITTYTDGLLLLDNTSKYDLLLLDIDMPSINGFDLAEELRLGENSNNSETLIYISSYDNLVFKSFQYSPMRFVRKNNLDYDLTEAIQSYVCKFQYQNEYFMFIDKDTGSQIKIKLQDIFYFEVFGHDICLIDESKTIYKIKRNEQTKFTLDFLENQLASKGFIRSNKSYLVNYKHIYKIQDNKIFFSNGSVALVTMRNIKQFKLLYQKWIMKE